MVSNGTEKRLADLSDEHRKLAQAVKAWWRESAREWWATSGRTEALCDDEEEPISPGEGFKTGRRLICERCADLRLTQNVDDWDLAIRAPDRWFGPGVPQHLIVLAESLWPAPQPSADAEFTMRIGDIFESRTSVMVSGTPQGITPAYGDEVEVVGSEQTMRARVTSAPPGGHRAVFTLEGLEPGSVKVGDILQYRKASGQACPSGGVTARQIWGLVGPSSLRIDADEHIVALGQEAVPAVMDVFANPTNRFGERSVANQAHLAIALEHFGNEGNQQAAEFLGQVARGGIPVYGISGRTALYVAKRLVAGTGAPEETPRGPEEPAAQPIVHGLAEAPVGESSWYAGFWRRVAALTIDFVLVAAPPIGLLMAYVTPDGSAPGWVEPSMGIWLLVVPFLAIVLPLRFFRGQTLGKRVMGIAVVSDTGGRLSWKQSLLRPVLYEASYFPVFVGFLWCIWDTQKRCFHDMIARTLVIHKSALPEVGVALAKASEPVQVAAPGPVAEKAAAEVEVDDRPWMIGKARVLYAMNKPALDALGSKSGASPGQIMATAIVVGGFGQRKELTTALDGTIRLSMAGEMKLSSLYLYRDAQDGVVLTQGKIEGSPEFTFLGRLSKTDYALALCMHFGLDTGMLRTSERIYGA